MQPKMIALFCIAQLGAIGAGYLCAFRAVADRARLFESMGSLNEFPTGTEFIAHYGWALVITPVACVFMIPRQREDEDKASVEWRWPSYAVVGLGAFALVVTPMVGIDALMTDFRPLKSIMFRDPPPAKKGSR